MAKSTIKGNCFICGKTSAKTASKNHILKDHNSGDEQCYLIKAEGDSEEHWLFFSISLDTTLLAMDKFLRQIWCECCGHMSAFRRKEAEFSKSKKVSSLSVGDDLVYEYDFGSTTEILLTVVSEISRPKQREKVRLLVRNEPYIESCDTCQSPATQVNVWEAEYVCDNCAKKVEDEAALLPLVNSPRCGECGYTGEQDKWNFNPKKLDLSEAERTAKNRKRNYYWAVPEKDELSAQEKWNKIDKEWQDKLVSNVFCGKCGNTTIVDYEIEDSSHDIVLRGKCAACDGKVARVVECN